MTQQLAAAVAATAALAGCSAGTDAYEVAAADVTLPPPPLCVAVVRGAWHAPVRIDSSGTPFTIRPHVATSRGGTAVATWLQSAPNHTWNVVATRNQNGLFASTWDAAPVVVGSFSVNALAGTPEPPRVAIDDTGRILVVWVERSGTAFPDPFTIRSARWTSARGWDPPLTVASEPNGAGGVRFDLAMAGNGDAVVVWDHGGPAAWDVRYAAFTPATFWLPPADLEHSAGNARSPVIASQPDLWMTAAWLQESDILGEFAVHASRFDLGLHSFGSFLRMNALGTSGEAPAVATTDDHASIVTWRSPLPVAAVQLEFTRIDAAGAVDGPHTLATGQSDAPPDLVTPSIALDDSGNALAGWATQVAGATAAMASRIDPGNALTSITADTRSEAARDPLVRMTPTAGLAFASWRQADGLRGGLFVRGLVHQLATSQCPESWRWDSAPTKLQDAATDDAIVFSHDLSVFPSGRAFAVWVQEIPAGGFGIYAAERR